MALLQTALSFPIAPRPRLLSFSSSLTGSNHLSFQPFRMPITTKTNTIIRMGGGPRTFPGGVSKWQWKRMQAKKAKQLLKARLCRERQIYEMRKRAELKAAVSELERPWEVVERAPNLFSVRADEQVKVLADRFQKPGGFDLWTESDGPQLFETVDDLPSARFFPKGVVHSIKPYKSIAGSNESLDLETEAENEIETSFQGNDYETSGRSRWNLRSGSSSDGEHNSDAEDSHSKSSSAPSRSIDESRKTSKGKSRNWRGQRKLESSKPVGSTDLKPGLNGLDRRRRIPGHNTQTRQYVRSKATGRSRSSHSDVYDMNLEQDGSYRFQSSR